MSIDLVRLPPDLRKLVSGQLGAGEKVLYAGMPDWRATTGELALIFGFGLFWSMICFPAAFFIWAETLGFRPPSSGESMGPGFAMFFSIFIIPFVVIGIAMLGAPFFAARSSARTAHVVTDQRLINVTAGKKPRFESFKLQTINFIKRHDGKGGKGSLSIGYGVEKDSDGDTKPLTTDWPGIPDARRAEVTIREHAKWAR